MDVMENIRLVLTRNMKVLRKARKLNQEQLAEKSRLSTGFIKDVERGHSWVSPESLEAIARGLDCQVGDLFATGEAVKVVQYQPVSTLLKQLSAIPDEAYEMFRKIPPGDAGKDVWALVEITIKNALMDLEEARDGEK